MSNLNRLPRDLENILFVPSQLLCPRHMSPCMINEVEGFTFSPFKDFSFENPCVIQGVLFTEMSKAHIALFSMFMLYVYP